MGMWRGVVHEKCFAQQLAFGKHTADGDCCCHCPPSPSLLLFRSSDSHLAPPHGVDLVLNLFLCLPCRSRKDSLESDSSTAIVPHELIRTRQLESVHLKFNQESGALIPLCLR